MVFNAIFNNISVISRQSVLLVEETGILGENYRPVANFIYISTGNYLLIVKTWSLWFFEF